MSGEIHPYWLTLRQLFEQAANPDTAAGAAAYMKNISSFYGIKAPERRALMKDFIASEGLPSTETLEDITKSAWMQEQREFQYAAMEVLHRVRHKTDEKALSLYEWMIVHKSWWDTVDFIASNLVGGFFQDSPSLRDSTIAAWMKSDNMWLQRTCLLFQLKYKTKTDEKLLFSLIRQMAHHPAFFIRKAVGWSLREYAKTQPQAVSAFVASTPLSGLSKREALKHLNKQTDTHEIKS